MSMVYDPVTREFKPRESRAEKPTPADLAALEGPPEAIRLPAAPSEPRRSKKGRHRHSHRRRDPLAYFLILLVLGVLLGATVWVWGNKNRSRMPEERSPLRLWRFGGE